jgi:hypothetical protein
MYLQADSTAQLKISVLVVSYQRRTEIVPSSSSIAPMESASGFLQSTLPSVSSPAGVQFEEFVLETVPPMSVTGFLSAGSSAQVLLVVGVSLCASIAPSDPHV